MLDRIGFAGYKAYFNAKRKMNELKNTEDGMETLETIILVAVAVVVAILIVNVLTKNGFQRPTADGTGTEPCGLIAWIFNEIKEKISEILKSNKTSEGTT